MIQELLEDLVQKAHDPITAGLTGKESAEMELLFTNLLRPMIETIYQTTVHQKEAVARRTGEDLIRRIASVPPKDRLDYIVIFGACLSRRQTSAKVV